MKRYVVTFSPSTWSTRLAATVKSGFYSGNQMLFSFPYFSKCVIWREKLCVTSLSARYATSGARQICVRRKWTNTHILTLGFSRQISKCRSRLSYLTISVELATTTHWFILLFSIRKSRIWWYSEFGYRNLSVF